MRESRGKREEAETAERFPPKKNFINGEDPVIVFVRGFYTTLKQYKLPKSTKAVNCYKEKMGRNQKRN